MTIEEERPFADAIKTIKNREIECMAEGKPNFVWSELEEHGFFQPPCCDHMWYIYHGGVPAVMLEPYHASDYEIVQLIDFCKELGLSFIISGDSQHFPGRTLRIIIKERKLSTEEEEVLDAWIGVNIIPRTTPFTAYTSYHLRRAFVDSPKGFSISNEHFKSAMLRCGYTPANDKLANWVFGISQKSPVLKCR